MATQNNPNLLGGTPADGDLTGTAGQTVAGNAQTPTLTTPPVEDKGTVVITAKREKPSYGPAAKPGRRLENPLGNFSSYTYQLSLYMITPDAYNAFVQSGRKNINALSATDANGNATNGGAFLIAQSGGINNKTSRRPPGFDVDYYIDDLKIKSLISSSAVQGASNVSFISFNIYEPYGFSFITKLKRAREALIKNSKLRNYEEATNGSKQFFVLGVRFQGYDKNGNVADAKQFSTEDTYNTTPSTSGVFERFYDIMLESLKFKINGSATTYNIVAKMAPTTVAFGAAHGTIDNMIPISAGTVEEALYGDGDGITSLITTLNETQKALEKAGDISKANVYDIKFVGDTRLLEKASLISDADKDKKKQAMSTADKSSEVNEATSVKSTPNVNRKLIQITKGTPIQQAINNIIKQSSYMEDALKAILVSNETPNEDTDSPDIIANKDVPPVKWYNLSAELECLEFDPIVNDFAYKITYVIQPYETPGAATPYTKASKYPGPYKRYDYWFTGKNREIISYEQTMDNTFFTVASIPNGDPGSHSGDATVPTYPNKKQNQDSQGRLDNSMDAQNAYMTSLYDPGAYAIAKIQILGDPDYLTQETVSSVNQVYNQYYGYDGFSINPNGGQVFIEIDFKEAKDYKNSTGLLDVNDSIYFWDYPPSVKNIVKGVSYQVRECESVFKGGKFIQNLVCKINDFPEAEDSATQQAREARSNFAATDPRRTDLQNSDVRTTNTQAGSGPTPSSTSTSSGTGLAQDKPAGVTTTSSLVNQAQSALGLSNPAVTSVPSTQTTESTVKGVANDDSVQTAGATQNGAVNSQNSDAGRETQDSTLSIRTSPFGSI